MFCKYCGKPIDETTMRCRICGRPVGPLEGGNGFWDLTGEKPAETPAGDSAALQELQEQVQAMNEQLEELRARPARPAEKRGGLGVIAALLALLALAVGVYALFQLRGMSGALEELRTGRGAETVINIPGRTDQIIEAPREEGETAAPPLEGEQTAAGTESGAAGQTTMLITPRDMDSVKKYDLPDGITYMLWPDYFDGPRGENETKRQSITPRDPMIRQTDEILIFKASFRGQHTGDPERGIAADPGTYAVYWARIDLDENGEPIGVYPIEVAEDPRTPDPEKDRYIDRVGPGNSHALYIIGGAEDGEEGYYALIAENPSNAFAGHYAYISDIIELYIPHR